MKLATAVYLLLIEDEKILLLRRWNTGWEDGNYSLVAGHLEDNEMIIDAMIREAKEEINIILEPQDLQVIHVMHRYYLDEECIGFFLTATTWKGKPENQEPDKCDELRWFPLYNLPENIDPLMKKAIKQYQHNNFFSEFSWE